MNFNNAWSQIAEEKKTTGNSQRTAMKAAVIICIKVQCKHGNGFNCNSTSCAAHAINYYWTEKKT